MYSIVTVVYGVPIRQAALDEVESLGIEPSDIGIITQYSGSGDEIPAYCGVELSEFDEATDMALPISSIRHTPTSKEIAKATAAVAALPSSVRKRIKDKLDTYYVFSTS